MKRRARVWTTFTALLMLAACASAPRSNPFTDLNEARDVQVTIRNEHLSDRDVYIYWEDGPRQWLGIIPSGTSRTFDVRYQTGGVRFSGAPRIFVPVYPGDRLELVFPKLGQVLPPRRVRR